MTAVGTHYLTRAMRKARRQQATRRTGDFYAGWLSGALFAVMFTGIFAATLVLWVNEAATPDPLPSAFQCQSDRSFT